MLYLSVIYRIDTYIMFTSYFYYMFAISVFTFTLKSADTIYPYYIVGHWVSNAKKVEKFEAIPTKMH